MSDLVENPEDRFSHNEALIVSAVQCANNQIHKECGSMCQRTCQSTAAHCDDHACIDGCFCPDGMVLHNDTCVDPVTCPCVSNGKEYKGGEEIQRDCNKWLVY